MFDLPGSSIRKVIALTARWRVAPEALLDGLPVTLADLDDPSTRVPIRLCEAIVSRAHQLTGEPALAFHAGMSMRASSQGFLGFAAMTASTIREALELACRFVGTRTSAIGLELYGEGDVASVVIEERTPLGALREFAVLTLIVGIWQIGNALTGKMIDGWGECAFPAPPYVPQMRLGDRLRFDRPVHRMVFAARLLDAPLTSADAVATRLAREQCERELAMLDAHPTGRVRAAIAARPEAALAAIAKQMKMSERTLKRRLAEHDTNFSALREEVRLHRALLLLDDKALSVSEVASRLGYTELPNFTRAFRKWTGMTPVAYRGRGDESELVPG
jgi:AraC-like DNA-binding protein